jgi:hypothetical protein
LKFQQITQHYSIPEDRILHNHCCKNLKSVIYTKPDQLEHIPNVLFIFKNGGQAQGDSLYRILDVARCVNGFVLHGRVTHSIGREIKTCIEAEDGHFEHLV